MEKDVAKILEEPFMKRIIVFIDDKNNISDICKSVDLTYKTTFNKIKTLEREGLILIKGNKISINSEYKKDIDVAMMFYRIAAEKIKTYRTIPQGRNILLEILKFIEEKRFVKFNEVCFKLKELGIPIEETTLFAQYLEEVGLIRKRIEISKEGKTLIKNLESNSS
jgi:predicted transcriptional regulator